MIYNKPLAHTTRHDAERGTETNNIFLVSLFSSLFGFVRRVEIKRPKKNAIYVCLTISCVVRNAHGLLIYIHSVLKHVSQGKLL